MAKKKKTNKKPIKKTCKNCVFLGKTLAKLQKGKKTEHRCLESGLIVLLTDNVCDNFVEKKRGRKFFDGRDENDVLTLLKEVWQIGGTDIEACINAKISTRALFRYMKVNKEVKEIRDRLKESPTLKARRTIVNGLDDEENAQWYLERKKKKEFSKRQEFGIDEDEGGIDINITVEGDVPEIERPKPKKKNKKTSEEQAEEEIDEDED